MNKMTDVFITVKTYPTLSRKYVETVCTAGITKDGNWIRIYPVPFRMLKEEQKYVKYQWLSLPIIRNIKDFRPESYRVTDTGDIIQGDKINDWNRRREIIFNKNAPVYDNMDKLILDAKDKKSHLSLATFKPQKILDFIAEETESNWSQDKLELLKAKSHQQTFFQTPEEIKQEFYIVKKVPYNFSYKFSDSTGKSHTLKIFDWEIGQLYWNCLKRADYNKNIAVEKARQKYFDDFLKKDIYLFLGTTHEWHNRALNPFVIIGVFYPPIQHQATLF
jgi:hypothetical protein